LSAKNNALQQEMKTLSSELKAEMTRSQELQAQNERAMNIALDEFSKKFEEQNKTVEAVQSSLDERFNKQLIYFVLALVAVVIFAAVLQKTSVSKAIKSHNASWNNFQEHILKK
jgi:Flp pilus assembly protein TadB